MIKHMLSFLLALTVVSCCGGQTARDETPSFMGTVVIIGNEPFTSPALQTADGVIYRLSCAKDMEVQLRGVQGKRVRLDVNRLDASARELHVTRILVLTEDQQKGTP